MWEKVMSHIWMSHGTQMSASCHIRFSTPTPTPGQKAEERQNDRGNAYEWVILLIWTCRFHFFPLVSSFCFHSHTWTESRRDAARSRSPALPAACISAHKCCRICSGSLSRCTCVYWTWLIHTWDVTHLCVPSRPVSVVVVAADPSAVAPVYVGHDSFILGTWLIHVCNLGQFVLP